MSYTVDRVIDSAQQIRFTCLCESMISSVFFFFLLCVTHGLQNYPIRIPVFFQVRVQHQSSANTSTTTRTPRPLHTSVLGSMRGKNVTIISNSKSCQTQNWNARFCPFCFFSFLAFFFCLAGNESTVTYIPPCKVQSSPELGSQSNRDIAAGLSDTTSSIYALAIFFFYNSLKGVY